MVDFKALRKMIEVKGNGNIVARETQVSSFIRLHLSGKGVIELIQSSEEKVIIETDENLLDYFEVVNSGRTLYMSSDAKFRKPEFTKCLIKVFLRQIDTLFVRCESGDVICSNGITLSNPLEIKIQGNGSTSLDINAPSIKVLSQTHGHVVLKGNCNALEVKNQSDGDFISKELRAENLKIKNMSTGNVELYASKEIIVSHYGEGNVYYSGEAVLKDVKQYGAGVIKHREQ